MLLYRTRPLKYAHVFVMLFFPFFAIKSSVEATRTDAPIGALFAPATKTEHMNYRLCIVFCGVPFGS